MPYEIRSINGQFCVFRQGTDKRIGCHPTKEKASRQMAALYANEPQAKASSEMKAENLTERRLDRWLSGDISRRVLVIPFSGPLPGGKAGLDLDGEYFDDETDLFGPYPGLKASRWREMDWHHNDAGVPPKRMGGPVSMKGAVIGEIEFDENSQEDGLWADWWIKQGRARRELIAARRVAIIERMGEPLYGSSQAMFKQKASDGHIEVWPVYRHTATTSPQNTNAVIPPLKALLAAPDINEISADALKALFVGLDASTVDLLLTSAVPSDEAAKAGRVLSAKNMNDLRAAIEMLSDLLSRGVLLPLAEDTGEDVGRG